jgi:transposase-like protein
MIESEFPTPTGIRYPYLWLDAQCENVREGGRVTNTAFLVAIAVPDGWL